MNLGYVIEKYENWKKKWSQIFHCNFIRGYTVITELCTSSILDFVNRKHPDYHSRKI